jgi:phosphatidylserine/phosphatidylglycerophosphate/cardiolipin synthase-like enzyme
LIQALIARNLPLEWAHVRLVYDDPIKTLDQAQDANLLFTKMREAIGTPARELDIISPYFVPGKQGTLALSAFPESGVQAAYPDQLTGGHRRRCGACRLRQAPRGTAAQRREDLRAQAGLRQRGWQGEGQEKATQGRELFLPVSMPKRSRSIAPMSSSARSIWTRARFISIPRWDS